MYHLLNLSLMPCLFCNRKIEGIDTWFAQVEDNRKACGKPWVCLCYPQNLDESITARQRLKTSLSSSESANLTHLISAAHDAILVSIGRILMDNPQLSIGLVSGRDPQTAILDSRLRIPPAAKTFQNPKPARIVTTCRV